MKFLILTLTIAVVNSRPQVPSGSRDGTAVQWAFLPINLQLESQTPLQLTTPAQTLEHYVTQLYSHNPLVTQTYYYQPIPKHCDSPECLSIDKFLKSRNISNRRAKYTNSATPVHANAASTSHLNTNDKVTGTRNANERLSTFPSVAPRTSENPIVASIVQDVRVVDLREGRAPSKLETLNEETTEETLSSPLIPYKAHPLFHYLKNKNTLQTSKIISFRNDETGEKDLATLILKPVAKAVAGEQGKAIATPLSRAILRQGTNVDILYEPEAVAIAGPGGIAHAQSDLEIFYDDEI